MKLYFSQLLLLVGLADAWTTPSTNHNIPVQRRQKATLSKNAFSTPPQFMAENYDAMVKEEDSCVGTPAYDDSKLAIVSAALVGLSLAASPESALAATTSTAAAASSTIVTAGGSISSALFAYGHYISIIGVVGVLMTERLTLENGPNLTEDEENRLAIADTIYGLIGLLVVYTGYCRVTDPVLGKGSYFYLHEPVFWLKMAFVSVWAAASLFNTTKIIQRSVGRFMGDKAVEPMSEALCDRMKSICNAQLTGIVFIPMAATFMARGIGYNESIPWQAEAGVVALLFLGLGFKYIQEAVTFEARLLESEKDSNTVAL